MNAREALMPSAEAAKRAIVYEMPLNERMRNFLRLDFLYHQAVHHHTRSDPWSTRAAVDALLEILAITSRGDLRGEVLKDLERQMSQLSTFGTRPGVDASRLRLLLTKMHRLREELTAAGALFLQRLRDSEFLNAIKHRSTIPGGTCEFDLPDYTHWLNQPDELRGADFANWLAIIRPLGDADGDVYHGERVYTDVNAESAMQHGQAMGLDWLGVGSWASGELGGPRPKTWGESKVIMKDLSRPNFLFNWTGEKPKGREGHACFIGLSRPDNEAFGWGWTGAKRPLRNFELLHAIRASGGATFANHP